MTHQDFKIKDYELSDHDELLRLLLELHKSYFSKMAPQHVREISRDKNIELSYNDYVSMIDECEDDTYQVLLANTGLKKNIGFIIGSIHDDDSLVYGRTGKVEDWYVAPEYRKAGIGSKLYNELEDWFRKQSCHRIVSDTWAGNELGIAMHQQMGLSISGISFSKLL